ncbi:hypothetical protein ACHQM5_005890 [Ranunculus cassubicifolius]
MSSCKEEDTSEAENTALGCVSILRSHLICGCKSRKQVNAVESDHPKEVEMEEKVMKVGVSPGIIGRLMGLESMPEPEPNWAATQRIKLDSVRRSRSVNSIDFWSEFDPVQGMHRRVRTAVSFRELPTFIEVENSEFLLVRSQKKRTEPRERKTVIIPRQVRPRDRRDGVVQKKEKKVLVTARPIRNVATSVSSPKKKPEVANRRSDRDRENVIKMEQCRCSLKKDKRKSSLETLRVKSRTHPQGQEIVKQRSSNVRRKQPQHSIGIMNAVRSKKCTKSSRSVWKSGRHNWKFEGDDFESLMWKRRDLWERVHIKEIGIEFGLRILDRLVQEVVAELSGLSIESLGLLLMDGDV